jgi:hypothetical protein
MSSIVPQKIKSLIRQNKTIFSQHFVYDKDLSVPDVENAILNAYFCEKQKDEMKQAIYKYCIYGDSLSGKPIVVMGKIMSIDEEEFFVITAYVRRK